MVGQSWSSSNKTLSGGNNQTHGEATTYFFMRLAKAYGPKQMESAFGGDELRIAMTEWSSQIDLLTQEQIHDGFCALQDERGSSKEAAKRLNWPNIAYTIALCKPDKKHACHKPHPALLELPKPQLTAEQRAAKLVEIKRKRMRMGV